MLRLPHPTYLQLYHAACQEDRYQLPQNLDALIYRRVRVMYFYYWGDANEESGMSV